jgi:hypothetical protein
MEVCISPWQFCLLGDKCAPGAEFDNRFWLFSLGERVDVKKYASAINTVLLRYPLFWSAFSRSKEGWKCICDARVVDDIVEVHRMDGSADEHVKEAATSIAQEFEKKIDLESPLLCRLVLLDGMNLAQTYLLLVINHLVFDWVSIGIFFREVERQMAGSTDFKSVSGASFHNWTGEVENYMQGKFASDLQYWKGLPWDHVCRFSTGSGLIENNGEWASEFTKSASFSAKDLMTSARATGVHPIDQVISAIALTVWEMVDADWTSVALWEHGRTTRDTLTAIGVFTYYWPVLVRKIPGGSANLLLHVANQRKSPVPKFGYVMGKYGNVSPEVGGYFGKIDKPQIHLNYTGTSSSGGLFGTKVDLPSGIPKDQSRLEDVVLYVFGNRDQVFFRWDYSSSVYSADVIKSVASKFGRNLLRVVAPNS